MYTMINNVYHCIETHTGDNPFTYKECGLCHKRDAGGFQLCHKCTSRFSTKPGLTIHVKRVHSNRLLPMKVPGQKEKV